MVCISFREKRGRCKKMNTFLKRNRCIDTETGISEWFRSICNLQTHTGLIPTVVTSVWQHVTHPISKHTHSLPHTHTNTHSSVPDCEALWLSAGSSGYGRPDFMEASLPHPLPLRRAPEEVSSCRFSAGQAWSWRRLVILGACVFYLPLFEDISTQRCCLFRYVGVIYIDPSCSCTYTQNAASFSAPVFYIPTCNKNKWGTKV